MTMPFPRPRPTRDRLSRTRPPLPCSSKKDWVRRPPMQSDLIARMRRALEAMDPVTRLVFERVRLDNRGYAQIADELGFPTHEVEQRFADALLQIWRHLDRRDRSGTINPAHIPPGNRRSAASLAADEDQPRPPARVQAA